MSLWILCLFWSLYNAQLCRQILSRCDSKKEIVLQININLGVGAYLYFVILGMFVILYIYCLNDVENSLK